MADSEYFTVPHLNRKQLARIFSKISVDQITGCWNWTAGKSYAGYGKSNWRSEEISSHRLVYAWLVEPLPYGRGGQTLDHFVCNNRACCNPAHLRLVTCGENVLRGDGPCARNARKTHCKRGHPLPDEPNLPNDKGRVCRICEKNSSRANYLRNREHVIARTKAAATARMNGPRREELLAKKRADYHARKVLKRRHSVSPERHENTLLDLPASQE